MKGGLIDEGEAPSLCAQSLAKLSLVM